MGRGGVTSAELLWSLYRRFVELVAVSLIVRNSPGAVAGHLGYCIANRVTAGRWGDDMPLADRQVGQEGVAQGGWGLISAPAGSSHSVH